MKTRLITLLVATVDALTPANAATITFDSLARGSVLTNQLQSSNILVSGILGSGQPFTVGEVLDVTAGDRGAFDLGGSLPLAILYGVVNDQLNFDFVLPDGSPAITDSVSLRVGDGDAATETFALHSEHSTGVFSILTISRRLPARSVGG